MYINSKRVSNDMSFDSRLIELIRGKEYIYDKTNEDYRNNELKDEEWNKIAINLKTDVERCKKRWASLRDRYKRIKKYSSRQLDPGSLHSKKWKYIDALSFIPCYFEFDSNQIIEYKHTDDDMTEDTTFEMEEVNINTNSTPKNAIDKRDRDHDLDEYYSNFSEETPIAAPRKLSVPASGSSQSLAPVGMDNFFNYLAMRVKAANLSSMDEMRIEAAILSFTVEKLSELQNEM